MWLTFQRNLKEFAAFKILFYCSNSQKRQSIKKKNAQYKNIVTNSRLYIFGAQETLNEVERVKKTIEEGQVVKEANLKEGRYVYIFNDMILICKPHEKKKGKLAVIAKIKIASLGVEDYSKHDPLEVKIRDISTSSQPYKWVFQCRDAFYKMKFLESFETVGVFKKPRELDRMVENLNVEMELENLKSKVEKAEGSINKFEKLAQILKEKIEASEKVDMTSERATKNSLEKLFSLKPSTAGFCFQAISLRSEYEEANKLAQLIEEKVKEGEKEEEEEKAKAKPQDSALPPLKNFAAKVSPKKIAVKASALRSSGIDNAPSASLSPAPVPKIVIAPSNESPQLPSKSPQTSLVINKRLVNTGKTNSVRDVKSRSSTGNSLFNKGSPPILNAHRIALEKCKSSLEKLDKMTSTFVEQMKNYKKNVRVKIGILSKLAAQMGGK